MLLTSATNHLAHSYDFTYDGLHRMTDAVYDDASGGRNRYNETVSYNANGSALTIKRNGRNDAGNYTAIDNLTLMYRGNLLLKVTDKGESCTAKGATDFNDGANITVEYTYDACGARTSDANKGIASIRYSYWGTPELIQFTNGSQTRYVYDASGVKQKRIHITAVDNIVVPLKTVMELSDDQILTSDTTEYSGNLVFENGRLDKVLFSSGYVSCSDDNNQERFTFHYFVKDHLGNNRAVVNESGAIEQTTHYYPFGNSIADIGTNASIQQYKYNGKELDRMHGLDWYDYGARNYDPAILQWDRPDLLAEKYYPVSPYVYCLGNPVRLFDLNGLEPDDAMFVVKFSLGLRFGVKVGNLGANFDFGSTNYRLSTDGSDNFISTGMDLSLTPFYFSQSNVYRQSSVSTPMTTAYGQKINIPLQKEEVTKTKEVGLGYRDVIGANIASEEKSYKVGKGSVVSEKNTEAKFGLNYSNDDLTPKKKMNNISSTPKGKNNEKSAVSINCILGISVDVDGVKLLKTVKDYINSAFDWIFK